MLRLIIGGYLVLMGFYAISNPTKLMQLSQKSEKVKEDNVMGIILGGIGSLVVGLLILLWWVFSIT